MVNVLLTINPVASHAAGTYLAWDGVAFDEEQTARCDAATPHELWAWTFRDTVLPGLAGQDRDEAPERSARGLRPRAAGVLGGQLAQPPAALAAATSAGTLPCR